MPRHSIFLKLALSLGAVILASFALVAVVVLAVGRTSLERRVRADVYDETLERRHEIARFLEDADAHVAMCARLAASAGHGGALAFAEDGDDATMRGAFREVIFVSARGEVVASTNPQRVGQTLSLEALGLDPAHASSVFLYAGGGALGASRQPTLVLSRPIAAARAGLGGTVLGLVDWRAVERVVSEETRRGPGGATDGFSALLDGRGRWLAGSREPLGSSPELLEIARNAGPPQGAGDPVIERGGWLLSRSDLEGGSVESARRWRILGFRHLREALSVVTLFTWSVVGAMLVGVALAGAVSMRIAKRLTRRIRRLSSATRSLARGELRHRVRDTRDDELGQLAGSLNVMAEQLACSRTELEALNERIEENSRLKSEFLANMSHELRTPLNGILGSLQLVLHNLCETREEEREMESRALESARGLLGQINDLLEVARLESGRTTLAFEPVEVQTLFAELRLHYTMEAQGLGLELAFSMAEEDAARACAGVRVRADAERLRMVLDHLIRNALKFTPRGAVRVCAASWPERGLVQFEVVDTGVGIPAGRQPRIFESFTQGDGSATRRHGGTGLGLSLARGLVELMGGAIGAESAGEGLGTRVFFSIPLWRGAESADVPAGGEISGPGAGPLVLVVEDDPVLRHEAVAELHALGYRTAEAETAEHGWRLARGIAPRFALVDDALACVRSTRRRTGLDLAIRMAAHPRTRGIPVAIWSAYPAELAGALERLRLAPATPCLAKPLDREAFAATLHELAGRSSGSLLRVLLAHPAAGLESHLRRVLPSERYELEWARSAPECFAALKEEPGSFDLLLLDATLGGEMTEALLDRLASEGLDRSLAIVGLADDAFGRLALARRWQRFERVADVLHVSTLFEHQASITGMLDRAIERGLEKRARSEDDPGMERAA